jgi:hypothetical protein
MKVLLTYYSLDKCLRIEFFALFNVRVLHSANTFQDS